MCAWFAAACLLAAWAATSAAQAKAEASGATVSAPLPDAPAPQVQLAAAGQAAQTPGQGTQTSAPPAAGSAGAQPGSQPFGQSGPAGGSAAQTPQQPQAQQTQHQKAAQQMKEEEQQRVLGIMPSFNISYRSDAAALSPGQKMTLAIRSAVDPFTFASALFVAGLHEAADDESGFGWGAEGYGKRAGAAYLDAFDGTILGNGILPIVFRQDPRYFRLGRGTVTHRLLYAIATSYICKSDRTRRWEPNYSNVGGNIVAGAISNLYYPSEESGWGETITNGFIVTTEGTVGGVFNEFWPDLSRKFLHKDPTHGLDAQAAAQGISAQKNPQPGQK